jgi:hypothetical protein
MAAAMTRRLRTVRRQVPLDRGDDYLLAWEAARHAVVAAGGRAWIFGGVDHEDQFLEFVEWNDDTHPSLVIEADVAAALGQLDAFGAPMVTDDWQEVA